MDNKEVINWLTRIRDRLMTTSSKQFESMTIAIAADLVGWIASPTASAVKEITSMIK